MFRGHWKRAMEEQEKNSMVAVYNPSLFCRLRQVGKVLFSKKIYVVRE